MPVKVLQVQMFGGFAMRYGNEAVTMNKIGTSNAFFVFGERDCEE